MDKLTLNTVQNNCLSLNKSGFKTRFRREHSWRADPAQSLEWHTAEYEQLWNRAPDPLAPLIPRGRSRSGARPGSWHRALVPRLGAALVLLGRRGARGGFGGGFLLPVLHRGRRPAAGLLVTARLRGPAAGTALRLYLRWALWARLALGRTGARLPGAWARLGLVGSGAGPARLGFPFSRVPSGPRTGAVAPFVAARTRPAGKDQMWRSHPVWDRLSGVTDEVVAAQASGPPTHLERDLERLLELLLLPLPRLLLRERRRLRDLGVCSVLEFLFF